MFKTAIAAITAALAIAAFALPSHRSHPLPVSSIHAAHAKPAVKHSAAAKGLNCEGCPLDACPLGSKADCGTCPATSCDK